MMTLTKSWTINNHALGCGAAVVQRLERPSLKMCIKKRYMDSDITALLHKSPKMNISMSTPPTPKEGEKSTTLHQLPVITERLHV